MRLHSKPVTQRLSNPFQGGWATLELVMLLPLIAGLFGLIFYFGQLAFLRLHLHSVTDVATRKAALYGCSGVPGIVRDSISNPQGIKEVACHSGDQDVKVTVTYLYSSSLPFFEHLEREFSMTSYAVNEVEE